MGEKYRRVYRFTPQKSRFVMYRSAILIHAAAPHSCIPTRCCLLTGRLTLANAVPHIIPSSFTTEHNRLMDFISFSMELSNWHPLMPKFSASSLSHTNRFHDPLSSFPMIPRASPLEAAP